MKRALIFVFLLIFATAITGLNVSSPDAGGGGANCNSIACTLSDDLFTDAANITGGTLADAILSLNVALLDTAQLFTADINALRINVPDLNVGNDANVGVLYVKDGNIFLKQGFALCLADPCTAWIVYDGTAITEQSG